ncbi:MAG: hypothetical protein AAGF95_06230 [Chloroflexota bacterium]
MNSALSGWPATPTPRSGRCTPAPRKEMWGVGTMIGVHASRGNGACAATIN